MWFEFRYNKDYLESRFIEEIGLEENIDLW